MKKNSNTIIAGLESRIDHLETELSYLNELLIDCGFPEGIETLKLSAIELIEETAPSAPNLSSSPE